MAYHGAVDRILLRGIPGEAGGLLPEGCIRGVHLVGHGCSFPSVIHPIYGVIRVVHCMSM